MDDTESSLLVAECDDQLRQFLVDEFLADRFEPAAPRVLRRRASSSRTSTPTCWCSA
jgi:hypothetical protein